MGLSLKTKLFGQVGVHHNISEKSDDSNFSTGYYFHPEVHVGFWQATDRFQKPILCHGVLDIIKCNQHGGFRRIFWKVIYFIHFYFIHFIHSSEKYYFCPEVFQFSNFLGRQNT